MLRAANLSLLLLFPVSWFAPLLRAGSLPPSSISTRFPSSPGFERSGKRTWRSLLLVTFLAIFAPYLKTIGLALVQFRLASPRLLGALHLLGRLAMADVFLIALYIVIAKGVGVGQVETAQGLYLFQLRAGGASPSRTSRIAPAGGFSPLTPAFPPRIPLPRAHPRGGAAPLTPCRPARLRAGRAHGETCYSFHLHGMRRQPQEMGGTLRSLRRTELHRRGGAPVRRARQPHQVLN